MSSQLNLEKVWRESGGDKPSSDQKLLSVTGNKVAVLWRGRGLSGSAYAVSGIRKDFVVMSKSGHTKSGPGRVHRQLLPGLLLWQPSQSMEEAGGRCPCFVWNLSQLSLAWGNRTQGKQQNMASFLVKCGQGKTETRKATEHC
jgi:hypothetical protein